MHLTFLDIFEGVPQGTVSKTEIEAGADIIETNTFNAQFVSMADYNMSHLAYEINLAAAACAKAAVAEYYDKFPERKNDGGPFVAGAIGPMNKTLSLSPDVENPGFRSVHFDEVKDAMDQAVDSSLLSGLETMRIIHGFGSGAVRKAVYDYIKSSPYIKSHRFGGEGEGLNGVTIISLK